LSFPRRREPLQSCKCIIVVNPINRSELNFNLPHELIAQEPAIPRDSCRLMVLDRKNKSITHKKFFDLGAYLQKGDVLVFNESKVLPARLEGKLDEKDREVLLLKEEKAGEWEVLIGGKVQVGDRIEFSSNLACTVAERREGTFLARFSQVGTEFLHIIQAIGKAPTPPYVKKMLNDPELYQTVYAKQLGSAAAPTAGLHFTKEMLMKLQEQGVTLEFVTLHVGLGTFQPIKTDKVEDHPIHSEFYTVDESTVKRIKVAKEQRRRVIAVGTTSVRVLETLFTSNKREGETSIFIYPGYEFKAVDALITNFHTPYSSLLALVFALAGQEFINKAYQEAIEEKYRFFSFGDAILIS
jgi:S-adenosylmethionine:tRNA ribosyltransferase-isomerase